MQRQQQQQQKPTPVTMTALQACNTPSCEAPMSSSSHTSMCSSRTRPAVLTWQALLLQLERVLLILRARQPLVLQPQQIQLVLQCLMNWMLP
jgi:hypothetical protein